MTRRPLTLDEVNALSQPEFVERFSGVLEHSPQYAERAAAARPFRNVEEVADAFRKAIEADDLDAQRALIRAHPDLAGKAALAGELTAESASEQSSAGLDRLTPEEYAEFHELNAAYHEKFNFPYVVCVRENTKETIFAGARRRLSHTPGEEQRAALHEIGRIARLRVLDLVTPE